MKKGFTLAEVLITLAIIGVVAAMTIPTLVSNISRKQHLSAFKKKFAEITEAVKLSSIDNQEPGKWNYDLEDDNFFATYLAPYLKVTHCDDCWLSYELEGFWFEAPAFAAPEICTASPWQFSSVEEAREYIADNSGACYGMDETLQNCLDGNDASSECSEWLIKNNYINKDTPPDEPDISYTLVNGSVLGFVKKESFFYIYLDLNGTTSPNIYGADRFVLTVSGSSVLPYGYGVEDLTSGEYGCSAEGNGMYCGAMIMRNNWDYPEDYPKL